MVMTCSRLRDRGTKREVEMLGDPVLRTAGSHDVSGEFAGIEARAVGEDERAWFPKSRRDGSRTVRRSELAVGRWREVRSGHESRPKGKRPREVGVSRGRLMERISSYYIHQVFQIARKMGSFDAK